MNKRFTELFRLGVFLGLGWLLTACHPRSHLLEPHITYQPQKRFFEKKHSDFEELSQEERLQEWGYELYLARGFAKDFDFYRAITCAKRALFTLPELKVERRMETEFLIVQCYYLGQKYREAVETFEFGLLRQATARFSAFRDLLVILYECYQEIEQPEKAEAVMRLLEKGDPETFLDLKLFTMLKLGDIPSLLVEAENHLHPEEFSTFAADYHCYRKSVTKAQWLNAILPGAGYFYVGQKKTALTSLLLNTSFIAATYYFFDRGNWGLGLFMTSLEFGWYLGGINGAGLAAKQYNESLYNTQAKGMMIKNQLFPVLMLETGF